jgi:hypothetical protein
MRMTGMSAAGGAMPPTGDVPRPAIPPPGMVQGGGSMPMGAPPANARLTDALMGARMPTGAAGPPLFAGPPGIGGMPPELLAMLAQRGRGY